MQPARAHERLQQLVHRGRAAGRPEGAAPASENPSTMGDPSFKPALERLTAEAAGRLQELVRAGEEIPYEVSEPPDGSALCSYRPLSERFVRDHAAIVRASDAFEEAREALGADAAGRYLETLGESVPPAADARTERALLEFMARLWAECSQFEVDPSRLEGAIGELQGTGPVAAADAEVVVALVGLQLPVGRLDLAGATLARADLVEVPDEARRTERSGAAPWEPVFLAILRGPAPGEGRPPLPVALERLLSTMRIFKAGGVAPGPHAWIRTGERWRRVSTGASRPRPGGYRLAESELGGLVDLARAVSEHPGRLAPLHRALARFEAGLARSVALDSLNDHLLALRFMLEGDGPAATSMPMRAAALGAASAERDRVAAVVKRALALERELWSGEPARDGSVAQPPAQVAAEIEELVRTILREVGRGRIGTDLRAAADETLLGEGVAIGGGAASELGGAPEWGAAAPEPGGAAPEAPISAGQTIDGPSLGEPTTALVSVASGGGSRTEPEPAVQLAIQAAPAVTCPIGAEAAPEAVAAPLAVEVEAGSEVELGWLDEADVEGETLDWPERPAALRALDRRPAERQALEERVKRFFPRPETAWEVGELPYSRRRAASTG
jgi:hypothetical protein